jgi:hypothetical protein
MLQPHSILWHYLWVAPNLFLLVLGFLLWKRGLVRQFPSFFAFATLSALGQLAVYLADVLPFVTPEAYWRVDLTDLVLEGVLKFALVGEIFARVFGPYASLARLGQILIRMVGTVLILAAAVTAAYAPKYELFGVISGAVLLEQSTYLIESGLLVFILVFAAYFHLSWGRQLSGITVGLSVSACVHLATWALMANGGLPNSQRILLVFLNMATYHACVLIWFYYLLVPKSGTQTTVPPTRPFAGPSSSIEAHEADVEEWNRELERLIHQ